MGYLAVSSVVALLTAAVVRRLVLRYQRICPSKELLNGKTVIITGANSGLGKAAAFELARRKARLIVACRTLTTAQKTASQIRSATGNGEVIPKELDLGNLQSIRNFSQQVLSEETRIDILLNNAGVFQCPYSKTNDGFEMQMGVNHLGHFALTNLLLDRIKESAPSRVVIVSSALSKRGSIQFDDIHCEKSYNKSKAYADSKLANLMFSRELAKRVSGQGVDVFSLHPGMVATNLGRHVVSSLVLSVLSPLVVLLGLRNSTEGAQTLVYCSSAKELTGKSGVYVGKDFKECGYPSQALDDDACIKLWNISKKLTGL